MLSKTGLAICAFASALIVAVTPIYAQATKTTINAATTPAFAPLEYKDPTSGKVIGFDIDLFEVVAKKMGAKVNWVETDWQQLTNSIKTKRADVVVAGMSDTPQLRETLSFVHYLNNGASFVTLRSNATQIPDTNALCGKRIANMRNSLTARALTQWSDNNCTKAGKPAVTVLETQGTADSRLQLNQNRADAAVQLTVQMGYQNTIEENRYIVLGEPFFNAAFGIAFSKDDPQFGETIKNALAAVIADGTYQELLRKWSLPDNLAIKQPMINGQP
ncbi:ABC transporter substrate-binding protein [Bradyrhizobium sp. INPA03-11B]|uniref:ABC transporter substrate-binding protein n=1 Tax=Bradyrhizobium sp. INPA03-11B TaxID=418598 RepID=UPI00338F090E